MARGPSVPLSKVPSVKQLSELLGFQRASVKDEKLFMDSTIQWRKLFTMSDGRPATELLDWNSPSVQSDLRTVAETFILQKEKNEKNENGIRFWSPSRAWAQESDLMYPNDKERIVELLMQLFWKQNRYLYNNNQYGPKSNRDSSREESTPVRDMERQKQGSAPNGSHRAQEKRKSDSSITNIPTALKPSPTAGPTQNGTTDPLEIFEIPDDADDLQASARASVTARNTKLHQTTGRVGKDNETRKRKRPSKEKIPRRTGRQRHTVVKPGVFLGDAADQVLDSAEAEEAAESLEMQETWKRLRQDSEMNSSIEQQETVHFPENFVDAQFNQTSSNAQFAAPTAPMISGDLPTQCEQYPSPERPSLKLRLKVPSSTQLPHKYPQPPTSTSQAQSEIFYRANPEMVPRSAARNDQVRESMMPPTKRATIQTTSTTEGPEKVSSTHSTSDVLPMSPAFTREDPRYRSPYVSGSTASPEPPTNEASQNLEMIHPTTSPTQRVRAISTRYTDYVLEHEPKISQLTRAPSGSLDPRTLSTSRTVTTPHADEKQHQTPQQPGDPHIPAQLPGIAKQDLPQSTVKSQAPYQSPAPVAKPKIQIPLWVILTRDPLYTEKQWKEGKFQGPPLSVFLEELNKVTRRSNIEKIELTLRTPFSNTILTVENGAEDAWTTAKATFGEKLKESRAEARMKRIDDTTGYKILIEPFYEQIDLLNGGAEAEEDVFDW